jgi:hypothetical protein
MGFGLFVLPIAGTLIVPGALVGLIAGAISERSVPGRGMIQGLQLLTALDLTAIDMKVAT